MKKKIFIILMLLMPILLIAQQDSTKQTFKLEEKGTSTLCGKCNDTISLSCFYQCIHLGSICGKSNDSITVKAPHKTGEIAATNLTNYKITGFTMDTQQQLGATCDYTNATQLQSNDENLTMQMIRAIESSCAKTIVKFYNIKCVLPDGSTPKMTDITLYINRQ